MPHPVKQGVLGGFILVLGLTLLILSPFSEAIVSATSECPPPDPLGEGTQPGYLHLLEPPCGRSAPDNVPLPDFIALPPNPTPADILNAFLKLPYREDGVVGDTGSFTLWEDPSLIFDTPGLNCSGFVITSARFLLGQNFSLALGKRDLDLDSGPDSPLGKDWDFGLDLILNLAGPNSRLFPWEPGDLKLSVNQYQRPVGLGLDIHSPEFPQIFTEFQTHKIYFFAISKPDRRFPSGLSYYHNGVIIRSQEGQIWVHHATPLSGVNRLDLTNQRNLNTFREFFPPVNNNGERRIIFVEAGY
jgi:hypothetical protein